MMDVTMSDLLDVPGLLETGRLSLPGAGNAAVLYAGFDVARFDPALFAIYGIPRTPSIERSVPKRQAEYFYGRLMACKACAAFGADGRDIRTGPGREPVWPVGLRGSITHTHALAMAAVIPEHDCLGIGIDAECLATGDAQAALVDTVLSPCEIELLGSVHALSPALAMTLAFSAKESLYKAAYGMVGRLFDFSAARVVRLCPLEGCLDLRIEEALCDRLGPGDRVTARYLVLPGDRVVTHVLIGPRPPAFPLPR